MDGIGDAVVVGRPNASGDIRLIAYFVATTKPAVTVTEIRKHLAQSVPDYMIPSVFVAMDALPQTPSGKTDRLHLPAVESIRPELGIPFSPPGTRVEEALAQIWAEAMGLDRLGIHDDFFELGGDSLMAMRLLCTHQGDAWRRPASDRPVRQSHGGADGEHHQPAAKFPTV